MKNKKFSWRVFISFGLFISFFIIFITGIILYLTPPGRVANWVNWTLFGLSKTDWQSLHTVFTFIFAILSIFHLFSINWRAFLIYLKSKTKPGLNKKRELFLSIFLSLLLFFGTLYSIKPISYIMEFGEYLTESWEVKENQPPVSHAEKLTVSELAEQVDSVSVEQMKNRLKKEEIQFSDEQTFLEIGEANNMSPSDLFSIVIVKSEENEGQGLGIGKMNLKEFSEKYEKNENDIMKILESYSIEFQKENTIKEIAEKNDMSPRELFDIIK